MPKPYPREFRDDVVRVARNREPGQHLKQIAAEFGISESCLTNWMKTADVEDGVKPGVTASENAELRSRKLVHALNRHRMVGSMGRVGAAGDNAAMESSFSLLQNNVLDRRSWTTREELRIAIVTWIERTHHRHRRQASLGRLTPVEYETIMTRPANQTA